MAWIWTGMVAAAVLCGSWTGQEAAVAAAAVEGAQGAIELCISLAGMMCLWTGVMEIMRRSGLAEKLSRLLRPVLGLIFPQTARDREIMDSIAANVSANLLGLGNAATPLGIEAARKMGRRSPGTASDAMCMLVVCNTASIQLIPTTVATVRSAAGCAAPFDILPAVWLASALSVGGDPGLQGVCPGLEGLKMEFLFTMVVPLTISGVALYGVGRRVDVYSALIHGAEEGLETLLRIVPALVGLLTAVSMLRASGALDLAARLLAPLLDRVGVPSELLPLMLVRPISGSAALGVGAELIGTYGPDSYLGRVAAVMLGSTETTFYTIAVYFGAVGVTRTRYALPAALCADLTGFLAAAWAVRLCFGG